MLNVDLNICLKLLRLLDALLLIRAWLLVITFLVFIRLFLLVVLLGVHFLSTFLPVKHEALRDEVGR